ncbi:MAG TPA: cytochrome c peroxidase [Caulobacteraceae bacterium]|jgi:cytochrome c peroxidase|nr:cytochrome c peroxidase [Caulobacteraceae bacterium]
MSRVLALSVVLLVAVAAPLRVSSVTQQSTPRIGEPITPILPPPREDPARVRLGEMLFGDPRLSGSGSRACSSCHDLATNGADGRRRGLAPDGTDLPVNTLTVFNAGLSFRNNWAGERRSLEDQAKGSIDNPRIMGGNLDLVVRRLRADPTMTQAFARAYGGPPDGTRVVDALATFERTLVTPNSRFDAWLRGDDAALNQSELQGYKLFKSIGCASCHQGVNMGGNLFQVSGVFHPVTGTTSRLVRVPSLRNAAATAPYFHDGSAPTLEAAIRTMGRAQLDRTLTVAQIDQIAAFLRTQTGQYRGRLVTAHP